MKTTEKIEYTKDYYGSDKEYFRKVLNEVRHIKVRVGWRCGEQDADPFNVFFTAKEFFIRLERLIEEKEK